MAEYIYVIPTEIKEKLTDEFYSTMWQELINVFGDRVKGFSETINGEDYPSIYDIESTSGWGNALHRTCMTLELEKVWQYWSGLEWDYSDRFDAEISEELAKRFSRKTNGDRIRQMTDEELAEFLWDEWMDRIICDKMDTKESMLKWLMKEVEDAKRK